MASNWYLPTLMFRLEQGLSRVPKESQRLMPNYEFRDDVIHSSPLKMALLQQNMVSWKPISRSFDSNHFDLIDPTITKPPLINIQDKPIIYTIGDKEHEDEA